MDIPPVRLVLSNECVKDHILWLGDQGSIKRQLFGSIRIGKVNVVMILKGHVCQVRKFCLDAIPCLEDWVRHRLM